MDVRPTIFLLGIGFLASGMLILKKKKAGREEGVNVFPVFSAGRFTKFIAIVQIVAGGLLLIVGFSNLLVRN